MIEGCREWQAKGLQPPEIVKEATALYFEAEDAIAAWIEECCERDPQAWAARDALYASWTAWALKAGEPVGSPKKLVQALEARLSPSAQTRGRGFSGLKVK